MNGPNEPANPNLTCDSHEAPGSDADWDQGLAAAFGSSLPTVDLPKNDTRIGAVIAGRYKLVELIGEGGMGEVWLAEQSEPIRRRVALKLIKAGMDSKQVIARFEAERQALAVMDHPNIAKVLDGGLHDNRPFFVMELVKGVPITQYCDANKLTPKQRLELFVPVCQAIQHAHQKGIIHRDIKPSNVLIAPYDDKPVPKVIDFGLAKATGVSLTDASMATNFGGVVGTPQYMSPEQASLNNLDIDTRSDIYSLGVLLYELLTGSPPFKQKDLEKAGMLEVLRVIREEEPPRPSTKLSTADALPSISANRGTEPKKLTGLLRNELDWIVMKALEKDRTRRYETANGFAADINRYLGGEPVVAHPPSAAYRLKKLLRRNKGPVIAASAVAAALLIGVIGFAWQAKIAQKERDIANEERNRAVTAEAETRNRANELELVSDFQAQMLNQVDTTQAGRMLSEDVRSKFLAALDKAGIAAEERDKQVASFVSQWQHVNATDAARELIDRTILKPAVVAIDKQFADQPAVAAALRQVLAIRYREMGMLDAARTLQEQALATAQRVLGAEHENTLHAMNEMAVLLQAQGKFDQAESLARDALEKQRRVLGDMHPRTLTAIGNMGLLLQARGELGQAEAFYKESLEKHRRLYGEHHPKTVSAINNMGYLLEEQGKYELAEPYFREALIKYRRLFGEEDSHTINSIGNLGFLLWRQGKFSEAEPYYRDALALSRRVLGEDHPDTLVCLNNIATFYRSMKKLSTAEPYFVEALEKLRRVLGEEHPQTILAITGMGSLKEAQDKYAEAESLHREAVEKSRRILGADHANTIVSIANLGFVLQRQNKLDEAEPIYQEALERSRRVLGDEHRYTLISIKNMGSLRQSQGKYTAAIEMLGPAEAAFRRGFTGDNVVRLGYLLKNLGKARKGLKEFAAAEPKLLEAQSILAQTSGQTHKDTRECTQALVELYTAWHAAEPGKGYDAKAAEWKAKAVEKDSKE